MGQHFSGSRRGRSHTDQDLESAGDPQLIAAVRSGDTAAYAALYQRHQPAAHFAARSHADNPSDADDIVAEAFTSVFASLADGKGPDEFFRAYLLTVVRRTAHARNRLASRALPTDNDSTLDTAVTDVDPVLEAFESGTMARAFHSLPERWQSVLWYMDVEQLKPAAAAPFVGLSANGTSSLLIRAREGLRQAYLQHHIAPAEEDSCAGYRDLLGKHARNKLSSSQAVKFEAHLDDCLTCTALLFELRDLQASMRLAFVPLLGIAAGAKWILPLALAPAAAAPPSIAAGFPTAVARFWKPAAAAAAVAAVAVSVFAVSAFTAGQGSPGAAATVSAGTQEAAAPAAAGADIPPTRPSHPSASKPDGVPTAPKPAPEPAAPPRHVPAPVPVPHTAPEPAAVPVRVPAPRTTPEAAVPPSVPPTKPAPPATPTLTATPEPEPTPQHATPATPQPASSDFEVVHDGRSGRSQLTIRFTLPEGTAAGPATASFLLSGMELIPGKIQAPPGWSCTEAGGQVVACEGPAAPGTFAFTLGVSDAPGSGTVSYTLAGAGIIKSDFMESVD
jgi:RNA polymerase sigma factor (sigma-70 family)